MKFESLKAENCFEDAENYEYLIELTSSELINAFREQGAKVRINDKLRRPAFIGELVNGTRIKGTLAKNVLKVGYNPDISKNQKNEFEKWMSSYQP